mmetsp:Transcript_44542/g.93466  ORF Transcript_44542/g.93466 Transcript_44542/m.93466 type:complete len:380 (-) Transcript_44542:119-1258(-)
METNQELAFRKNNNNRRSSDERRSPRRSSDNESSAMDDDEFNLHQNYHDAIECLHHCERLIKSQQEQLAAKDETIANLERKLIQMSLELASSKALEDEHTLLKRRMSDSMTYSLDNSFRANDKKPQGPDVILDDEPPRSRRTRRTSSRGSRGEPKRLTKSWSGNLLSDLEAEPSSRETAATTSAMVPQHLPNVSQSFNSSLAQGFLPRVMSWVNDVNLLDSSMNDSSKENMSWSMSDRPASPSRATISPISSKTTIATRRRSFLAKPTGTARRSSTQDICLGRQNTGQVSRGSSIANFLGMNKNGNANAEEKNSEASVEFRVQNLHEPRARRRDSVESTRSYLSGVLFPVSSADCLEAMDGFANSGKKSNLNEEWPTYQ